MTTQSQTRKLFAELINRPDEEINLGRAALLIAKEEYPHLEIESYLWKLDRMAAEVRELLGWEVDPHRIVTILSDYLFNKEQFQGNEQDYYNPRNSFLNDVLDRKTGIPITLSVIYLELANRLNLPITGVGFPGHFLVKYNSPVEDILIDPFHGGTPLTREQCRARLTQMHGRPVPFSRRYLRNLSRKEILARMLTNLKWVYLNTGDYTRALAAIDRLMILNSEAANEIRDRGLLYHKLHAYGQAMQDFNTYLALVPHAEDSDAIRQHVRSSWLHLVVQAN